VNSAGTWTTTVPVWPGKDGIATVDVAVTEPPYSDEIVENRVGTRTITVPGSPARDGTAIVEVVVFEPAYNDEMVVN
jgi:hypothetical protein